MTDHLFAPTLILATFLCSLVAGFLLAFAVVAMPGIRRLDDRAFIRTFQAIDGVIQNRQPVFMVMWIGSVVALVASAVLSLGQLDGYELLLILVAFFAYLLGVQLPTFIVHVPLNNQLQTVEVDAADGQKQKTVRMGFEPRWNRWNAIRTTFAGLTAVQLMYLLFRL